MQKAEKPAAEPKDEKMEPADGQPEAGEPAAEGDAAPETSEPMES